MDIELGLKNACSEPHLAIGSTNRCVTDVAGLWVVGDELGAACVLFTFPVEVIKSLIKELINLALYFSPQTAPIVNVAQNQSSGYRFGTPASRSAFMSA